jgi:hypothetical protein
VDGEELPALYTLHDRLAGHPIGEGRLEHGEPSLGSIIDEERADGGGEADPPWCSWRGLLAGYEAVGKLLRAGLAEQPTLRGAPSSGATSHGYVGLRLARVSPDRLGQEGPVFGPRDGRVQADGSLPGLVMLRTVGRWLGKTVAPVLEILAGSSCRSTNSSTSVDRSRPEAGTTSLRTTRRIA